MQRAAGRLAGLSLSCHGCDAWSPAFATPASKQGISNSDEQRPHTHRDINRDRICPYSVLFNPSYIFHFFRPSVMLMSIEADEKEIHTEERGFLFSL